MKRLYPIILLCLAAANGCQSSTAHKQAKSQFFDNSSLHNTINRMNLPHLRCSGSSSTDISGSVGEITSYRKASSLECEIINQAFDEKGFADQLRREIEQEIANSGAKLSGGGESGENFNCEYEAGRMHGAIEVVAGRVEANKYKLTCIIREIGWK